MKQFTVVFSLSIAAFILFVCPTYCIETTQANRKYEALLKRLQRQFETYLKTPRAYKQIVIKECSVFPEGNLYPFTLPAIAWAGIVFRDPEQAPHAREQMRKLIDLAIPQATLMIKPPKNDLMKLKTYQRHATYLGMLNYTLGCYRMVGSDRRYDRLHNHISEILFEAAQEQNGAQIHSYPNYSWTFDTILALASLDLHDRIHGTRRTQPLIQKHLNWINARCTDKKAGLPCSIFDDTSNGSTAPPRGCDLSLRICLLQQIAPARAADLYKKYVTSHWLDKGLISGFAEWPGGKRVRPDIDSGPVVMGIGLTATGVGIATCRTMGDKDRFELLCNQLQAAEPLIRFIGNGDIKRKIGIEKWFRRNKMKIQSTYFSGFLFGDATLFFALSWETAPRKPLKKDLRE